MKVWLQGEGGSVTLIEGEPAEVVEFLRLAGKRPEISIEINSATGAQLEDFLRDWRPPKGRG